MLANVFKRKGARKRQDISASLLSEPSFGFKIGIQVLGIYNETPQHCYNFFKYNFYCQSCLVKALKRTLFMVVNKGGSIVF